MKGMKKVLIGAAASAMLLTSAQMVMAAGEAKNVILMISDGMGFNTVKATDYYTGTTGVYEGLDFIKGSMQTNSANNTAGYNPTSMWSSFTYQNAGATDSASAATAMYTGVKNFDGQINKTTTGADLTTFFEIAANAGKATGAVSSVNFDHATPAAVVANVVSRGDYTAITSQMISSNLDVIMGAGNPNYNNNGAAVTPNYAIVGNQTNWNTITGGANGRTFIDSKTDFEALANGTLAVDKVFGVAQVKDTLQDYRSAGAAFNTNVPTLETMTKGALNVLDNNAKGFAVMIEGGAIDWANHSNLLDRSIQEQTDFNKSVQAVYDYLNANNGAGTNGNNWSNTLLIVTADHETGNLWGPTAGVFNQVVDNGVGNLPGAAYNSGSHTNGLVPFYAKGADAGLFNLYLTGVDENVDNMYGVDTAFNRYIDNTDVFKVMSEAAPVPVPGAAWLLGSGLAGLAAIRRRKEK